MVATFVCSHGCGGVSFFSHSLAHTQLGGTVDGPAQTTFSIITNFSFLFGVRSIHLTMFFFSFEKSPTVVQVRSVESQPMLMLDAIIITRLGR